MEPITSPMTQRISKSLCVSMGTKQYFNSTYPPSCPCVFVPTVSAGLLSVVMGMRYKKSGKLMPAGIIAALRLESSLHNKT